MLPELRNRVKKVGQPPGTPTYTGTKKHIETKICVITYSSHDFHKVEGHVLADCLSEKKDNGITWVHVQGLNDIALLEQLAKRYEIHPLTIEDILNVEQRPKVEEFKHYEFITLKMLIWHEKKSRFSIEQLSIILGKDFVLSFQESDTPLFNNIIERLGGDVNQRLRQQGGDYLTYRLIDTVVDYYFVVLENLGNQIDTVEELIISDPKPKNARTIYKLKRQILMTRKAIWPLREAASHLLQVEEKLISSFTRIYMRDLYDHIVQAIDTIETFRDMLSSLLDVYLSSLANRLNEVMKMLTMIATIFIPMTFIAGVFGMNFSYMPGLEWHWGYYTTLSIMLVIGISMLFYFWRKKWI